MMDKRNSPVGRNPTVIAVLIGLLFGQLFTLYHVIFGGGLRSFSGVIQGWPGVAYNVLGAIACGLTLFGISKQGLNVPVGRFVTGLIIEQWGKGALGLVMLVYSIQTTLAPEGTFPFIVTLIGIGCLWRWFDIRQELKEIQKDLLLLKRIQEYGQNDRKGKAR